MSTKEKLFLKIMTGSVQTVRFLDLEKLLFAMGFERRIKGSHHLFYHENITELINIQPRGSFAKPYQVRQIRGIISKYDMGIK